MTRDPDSVDRDSEDKVRGRSKRGVMGEVALGLYGSSWVVDLYYTSPDTDLPRRRKYYGKSKMTGVYKNGQVEKERDNTTLDPQPSLPWEERKDPSRVESGGPRNGPTCAPEKGGRVRRVVSLRPLGRYLQLGRGPGMSDPGSMTK
ncbi:Hypothetical predicted protein [Marmota monax]|uniref:Uncharacterized protein n=1 Tax=Marmota monax TaxID=9995 RepID=A0A5E4C7Z6_MARMO|nr:Hypothetical predicted protein [Marmota monax]